MSKRAHLGVLLVIALAACASHPAPRSASEAPPRPRPGAGDAPGGDAEAAPHDDASADAGLDAAEQDEDHDRIVAGDRCPREPERYNGFEDDDGCPDSPPVEQCMWMDYVFIAQRVTFARGRAELRGQRPMLAAVAAVLRGNPGLARVGVVGGASGDEPGPDALSLARARAVFDALVALGVPPARMEVHALGVRAPRERSAHEDRAVWFPILSLEGVDTRDRDGEPESHYFAWRRDCEAAWRAWREQGAPMDCECLRDR